MLTLPLFPFSVSTPRTGFITPVSQARTLNTILEFPGSQRGANALGKIIRPLCGKQEGMQKHI